LAVGCSNAPKRQAAQQQTAQTYNVGIVGQRLSAMARDGGMEPGKRVQPPAARAQKPAQSPAGAALTSAPRAAERPSEAPPAPSFSSASSASLQTTTPARIPAPAPEAAAPDRTSSVQAMAAAVIVPRTPVGLSRPMLQTLEKVQSVSPAVLLTRLLGALGVLALLLLVGHMVRRRRRPEASSGVTLAARPPGPVDKARWAPTPDEQEQPELFQPEPELIQARRARTAPKAEELVSALKSAQERAPQPSLPFGPVVVRREQVATAERRR
jgi:hypothetical protein